MIRSDKRFLPSMTAQAAAWLNQAAVTLKSVLVACSRSLIELAGEILRDRPRRVRLIIALACTLGSILIGLAFAQTSVVSGWQLWAWLACLLALATALVPPAAAIPGRTWPVLGMLFILALALRLTQLETIPGGLHIDETGVADFALHRLFFAPHQTFNPFGIGPASHPALYHYGIRLSLEMFGETITALRSSSALAGSLGVAVTYAMIAVISDRKTALFSAVLMAGYHYHLHWSRLALNNIWDTLWVPLMLATWSWGWRKGWSGGAVFSGLAFGFSQYFYPGSRIGFFLLAALVVWLWTQEPSWKCRLTYLGKFGLAAICVIAPLALYALLNWPVFIERLSTNWGWSPEAMRVIMGEAPNLPGYIWHQLTHAIGAYTIYADVTGFYGSGIPFLFGLSAPLFLAGLVLAVLRHEWLPVLWILLVAFFGGFLLAGNPSSSHFVVAIPAICWLVALPLARLSENSRPRWAIFFLIVILLTDLGFYFGLYVPAGPRDLIGSFPTGF